MDSTDPGSLHWYFVCGGISHQEWLIGERTNRYRTRCSLLGNHLQSHTSRGVPSFFTFLTSTRGIIYALLMHATFIAIKVISEGKSCPRSETNWQSFLLVFNNRYRNKNSLGVFKLLHS